MSAVALLGTTGAISQSVTSTVDNTGAEQVSQVFKGAYPDVLTIYNAFKAFAPGNPAFDGVELVYAKATGTLTVSTITDATDPIYELCTNELAVPVWLAPWFVENNAWPPMTADEIREVRKAYQLGTQTTNPYNVLTASKKHDLYALLCKGTEEILVSQYVLRQKRKLSKRSVIIADYNNVNRVEIPPVYGAINAILGALPPGEWLKKSPQLQQAGKKTYWLSTEWWWATTWSRILYGGTAVP